MTVNVESIDGVLGIETLDHRILCADESTELWWPPDQVFLKKWANPGLFFICFRSFQTNINTDFITNQCENMSFHPVFGAGI